MSDSNKASNMYQKTLMELKQYINDYTKGLYTQGNFDDQILKLIINPVDLNLIQIILVMLVKIR